jgi:superfamily I DNA/RNA helicase
MRTGGDIRSYDISFYEDERAQLNRLIRWIQELETQGYKTSEITLLSFRADHLSAAARLRSEGYRFRPAWQSGDVIAYASVHAFKGMENKVIILTDIDLEDQDFNRHLFYTGITRATECVRVLCDRKSQATLMRWLSEKSEHERKI